MKKNRFANPGARPIPPECFADPLNHRYLPAPEVLKWARAEILTDGGQLYNEDHAHMEYADVQFLWAPSSFQKQGRTVLGQCEEVTFRGGPWQKGRQQQQMADWFGAVPDYLITFGRRLLPDLQRRRVLRAARSRALSHRPRARRVRRAGTQQVRTAEAVHART